MGKISDAIGFDIPMGKSSKMGDMESPEEDATEPGEEPGEEAGGEAGVLAMKQFSRAASPEDKAKALYSFMQACGVC